MKDSVVVTKRPAVAAWARLMVGALLLTVGLSSVFAGLASAQEPEGAVHIVDISGEIDRGIAPYLQRALDEAEQAGAAAVVLEIDTPGGRLDAVLQMRDSLLDSPMRTIAYVDRTAFSAGALIALASEQIYFAPGASMGAATPVVGGAGETADPKVVSAVRSTFRATAQERGRDPLVGEAMVDPDIEIDGLIAAGSLLTLTESEATEFGYLDGVAASRAELLEQLDLGDAEVVETSVSPAERLVRFLTNPVFGSVLFTLGILLIVGELLVGAFGVAAATGVGLLGVFFYGHLLAGLTGWEDVVLVVIGLGLILVEIFVVPGFGIPGILGLSSVLGGGFLAMTGRDFDFVSGTQIASTATTILTTFVIITIGLIVVLTLLSRRGVGTRQRSPMAKASAPTGGTGQRRGWLRWFGDGDVLASEDDEDQLPVPSTPAAAAQPTDPEAASPASDSVPDGAPLSSTARTASRLGSVGIALSDLRPAGVADFDGHRVDVVTEGDYLSAGEKVEVVRAERYRRVVRRARDGVSTV